MHSGWCTRPLFRLSLHDNAHAGNGSNPLTRMVASTRDAVHDLRRRTSHNTRHAQKLDTLLADEALYLADDQSHLLRVISINLTRTAVHATSVDVALEDLVASYRTALSASADREASLLANITTLTRNNDNILRLLRALQEAAQQVQSINALLQHASD